MHRAKEGWEEEEKEWHQPPQTVIAVIIPSPPSPRGDLLQMCTEGEGAQKSDFPAQSRLSLSSYFFSGKFVSCYKYASLIIIRLHCLGAFTLTCRERAENLR